MLQELAATEIEVGSRTRRLFDEIDVVSEVSGGSFTAAYYGLFGDRIFEDFEKRFLRKNIQARLILQVFNPVNWLRMLGAFSRSEIASEFYHEHIFDGASFSGFDAAKRALILINATDLAGATASASTNAPSTCCAPTCRRCRSPRRWPHRRRCRAC